MKDLNPQATEITQTQAVNVLIQAARIAQGKGAFTLEDAELIAKAIKCFAVPATDGKDPIVNEESPMKVEA